MNKALRRHQQRVARLRHLRYIWRECVWYWHGWGTQRDVGWQLPEKPWQLPHRATMRSEPKHWRKQFNLQPSRIRQNQLLRSIERGVDPDAIRRWPDYRKPHIYYW